MAADDLIVDLADPAARDRDRTGSKAASLATLLQAAFPVPDGCVITTEAFRTDRAGGRAASARAAIDAEPLRSAIARIASRYRDVSLAVRSSALAEDLPDASFAGLYETILDVRGETALRAAIERCAASADSDLVRGYRHAGRDRAIAVIMQRLIVPELAGVALGADPITGNRQKVLISAVRGSGQPLVSGTAGSEDWEVAAAGAQRRGPDRGFMRPEQASTVASLVRRIEGLLHGPQDVEWALAGGTVWILQARPMTSVPPVVSWSPPLPGGWFRSIRLGEWLPEPLTPLFETWLLDRLERRFRDRQRSDAGLRVPLPLHVTIQGWYFHSPIGPGGQTVLLGGLLRRPLLAAATVAGRRWPRLANRLYFRSRMSAWRQDLLHPYQRLVADAEDRLERADPEELIEIVNQVADMAGNFLWSLILLGGAAWRSELALARFCHRHLGPEPFPYQALFGGTARRPVPAHAVHNLDWVRETLGELAPGPAEHTPADFRLAQAAAERSEAERRYRAILGPSPRLLRTFEGRLEVTRRLDTVRRDQGEWFTLGWPLLRRCAYRLGAAAYARGALGDSGDVFFLNYAELEACLSGNAPVGLAELAVTRRATWAAQGRLSPPLRVGNPRLLLSRLLLATPKFMREQTTPGEGDLLGIPASPGRATGRVRVLRAGFAADSVEPGVVLVVPAIVPALTTLFDRVVAICADGGSVAAHASIIAREYAIPAVTGLGDATSRLRDGTVVTVDGTTGRVAIR